LFKLEPPQYAHLPPIVDSVKEKPINDVSLSTYMNKGYLRSTLQNGAALLGWNPPHREDATVASLSTS